jgi:F-type H+-transporting ATPase subunit b
MEFFRSPENWVAIAFLLFIALLVYLKVPAMVARMLDERAARIAKDLDEARKLREEAQALLAGYQGKRAEADNDAAAIIEQARKEAEAYGEEARRKLSEMIERRTRQAEEKIAQAEAAAAKEVRAVATDVAIAAASRLMADAVKGAKADALVSQSIAAVKNRLN